jgi:hypothetical protein
VASATKIDPLWVWGEQSERPRVLHSRIRVRDVDVVAPKSMVTGAPQRAFVKDPDGYSIELIQIRRSAAAP